MIAESRALARLSSVEKMLLEAIGHGCLWQISRPFVLKANRTDKNIHEAPDGDHKEEANEAPDHKRLALLPLLFVAAASDEVHEDSPNEDNEGECEDDRNGNVVNETDKEGASILHAIHLLLRVNDSKRKGEREGGSTVEELFHKTRPMWLSNYT